ncbi:hypothetical protein LSM04_009526 [Trypanosoma melophagium]|uniref:uncharacterized protein n=1 Tax=Trypanosoma melophagium TaxID=715481 RepID=UPI00351A1279|nr:hypothetical protein LSM04_009526 [Trypanosoma melophagium]
MELMNTGRVQSMQLQSCDVQEAYYVRNDTHNVMPSEHSGASGTRHRWVSEKNRTTSLLHQRLSLQRVLHVLVVLWLLFGSNSFLCYAEAADTNGILTTITSCFPSVVIYPSQKTYYCEVDNVSPLSNLTLTAGYYTRGGALISGWPASLVDGTNLIAFVPDRGAVSGSMSVVITRESTTELPANKPISNKFTMNFVNSRETRASFTSNSAYYGLKAMLETNFPNTNDIQNYLLVPPQSDCEDIATHCTAAAGCYNLTTPISLPLRGHYSLCVTARGWRGHYLRWGAVPLEVNVLVLTTLYMNTVGGNKILFQDAMTGSNVTGMKNVFLVKCPYSGCPRVKVNSGDLVVSVDVCTGSANSDRVYLSAEGVPFSATAGDYAACTDFGTDVGISPAALPVRVLQDPFVFNATVHANVLATIGVQGGDLSWRQEPYEVCAVLPNTPCESVSTAQDSVCVESVFPRSPSVDIDTSSLYNRYGLGADNVTFCFVASTKTLNGRRYVWSLDVGKPFLHDGDSAVIPRSKKWSVGAIVGIVFGVLGFLVIVALILLYLLWWRPKKRREKAQKDTAESQPKYRTIAVQTSENPLTNRSGVPSWVSIAHGPAMLVSSTGIPINCRDPSKHFEIHFCQ